MNEDPLDISRLRAALESVAIPRELVLAVHPRDAEAFGLRDGEMLAGAQVMVTQAIPTARLQDGATPRSAGATVAQQKAEAKRARKAAARLARRP